MDYTLNWTDENEIRELLLYRSVTKVSDDTLVLDDGTVLEVVPNFGCGGCPLGNYYIEDLNGCENMITRVTFMEYDDQDEDTWGETYTTYTIFVYAENKQINLLSVEGTDGYGWYGTGYEIRVRETR